MASSKNSTIVRKCDHDTYLEPHQRVRQTREGEREIIFDYDNNTCVYCGVKTATPHCDHMRPRVAGGSNKWCNLVTACASCNLQKGRKDMHVWLSSWGKRNNGALKREDVFRIYHEGRRRTRERNDHNNDKTIPRNG